jgi:hypothetical protein
MAKVVFGGLVSEVRGTLGADVYTRNKSGGIVRTQTTLPWTNTTLRGLAVDYLNDALTRWSTLLSDEQRIAWNAFATMQTRSATAIARTQLSGQDWFIKLAVPLLWQEAEPYYDPPADLSVAAITSFAIDHIAAGIEHFVINWTPGLPANHLLIAKATDSMSLGISSWLHQQSLAARWSTESDTSCEMYEQYAAYHPAPTPGLRIGATARFLNLANGVYSRPLQATAIVGA